MSMRWLSVISACRQINFIGELGIGVSFLDLNIIPTKETTQIASIGQMPNTPTGTLVKVRGTNTNECRKNKWNEWMDRLNVSKISINRVKNLQIVKLLPELGRFIKKTLFLWEGKNQDAFEVATFLYQITKYRDDSINLFSSHFIFRGI